MGSHRRAHNGEGCQRVHVQYISNIVQIQMGQKEIARQSAEKRREVPYIAFD